MFVRYYIILAALCSLQLINGAITPIKEKDEKVEYTPILFPGPTNDINNRYNTEEKDIPDECKNQTFCSVKPNDYPQEFFDKIYKGTKGTGPMLVLTDNRQGDPDDMTDCESEVEYQPLYKVRSKRGWHTVAQSEKENFVQMVRLEKCKNTSKPCFTRFTFPPDLETFCKQTYSFWEFVVLTEDKSGTEKVQVELPVCCSCHYKSKGV